MTGQFLKTGTAVNNKSMNKAMSLLLSALVLFNAESGLAQKRDLPWAVPINEKNMPAYKGFYRFPGFAQGTVIFRDGRGSSARLNYNISLDEMQFINQQGDTLAIADPDNINLVNLNGTRFYYNNGYLQAVDVGNEIILASRQVLIAEYKKGETFNTMLSPDEKGTGESLFTRNGQKYSPGTDGQMLTSKEHFFFGDGNGGFTKAGKEYILRRYDKNQTAIKEFLKANHTDFNKRADILQLLQFCNQLK